MPESCLKFVGWKMLKFTHFPPKNYCFPSTKFIGHVLWLLLDYKCWLNIKPIWPFCVFIRKPPQNLAIFAYTYKFRHPGIKLFSIIGWSNMDILKIYIHCYLKNISLPQPTSAHHFENSILWILSQSKNYDLIKPYM